MQTITETGASPARGPSPLVADAPAEFHDSVYVIATTCRLTAHALKVAHALAAEQGQGLTVLLFPPKPLTISSARAHVQDLPIADPGAPTRVTPEFVRALLADEKVFAELLSIDARTTGGLVRMLPPRSRVVLAGTMRHFVEEREQRLARTLVSLGYDVTFVPCADR